MAVDIAAKDIAAKYNTPLPIPASKAASIGIGVSVGAASSVGTGVSGGGAWTVVPKAKPCVFRSVRKSTVGTQTNERAETDPCPFCRGTGVARDLIHVDSLDAWATVLLDLGVDDGALHDWCTLFAASEGERRVEALSVVHKLLLKESGNNAVENPSGFVVAAVKNAWRKLRNVDWDNEEHDNKRRRSQW